MSSELPRYSAVAPMPAMPHRYWQTTMNSARRRWKARGLAIPPWVGMAAKKAAGAVSSMRMVAHRPGKKPWFGRSSKGMGEAAAFSAWVTTQGAGWPEGSDWLDWAGCPN